MRMLERLRLNLFMPIEPQSDSKERREQADVTAATADVSAPAEGMFCGHCSGNVEAHIP